MPRIVAVVGPMASGKDALADYLVQRHQVMAIEMGAFARELAKDAAEDEPYLQYDVSAKRLTGHGPEYIMQRLVSEIRKNEQWQVDALVITGVRTPAEAAVLQAQFGTDVLLVYVRVGSPEKRYERVNERDFATDPANMQDFLQQDAQMKTENALGETAVLADTTLWNNGSLEDYYRQIETQVVPHLFPQK